MNYRGGVGTRVALIVTFGLVGTLLGMLIAIQPPLAARVGAVMALLVVLGVAWVLPDVDTEGRLLARWFLVFAVLTMIWPKYVVLRKGGLPALNPEKLAYYALLMLWLWSLITSSRLRARLAANLRQIKPVLWMLGMLALWRLVTGAMSGLGPFLGLKTAFAEMFVYYSMLFIGLTAWSKPSDVKVLLKIVVLVAVVVSVLGAYEGKVKHTLFGAIVQTDDDQTGLRAQTLQDKFRGGKYRVQSTFEHPLVLAEFLVLSIALAIYCAATTTRLAARFAYGLAILLMCYVVYKTDSRAAMSTVAVVFFMAGALYAYRAYRKNRSIVGMIAGLMLPAALLMVPLLVSLVSGIISGGGLVSGSASTPSRIFMIQRGVPLMLDSPLFGYGVGMGIFKVGYTLDTGFLSLDNYFLTIGVDSGFPALIPYIGIFVWFGWKALGLIGDRRNEDGSLAVCLLLVVIGFFAMRSILSIATNSWLFFALMGGVALMLRQRDEAWRTDAPPLMGVRRGA